MWKYLIIFFRSQLNFRLLGLNITRTKTPITFHLSHAFNLPLQILSPKLKEQQANSNSY